MASPFSGDAATVRPAIPALRSNRTNWAAPSYVPNQTEFQDLSNDAANTGRMLEIRTNLSPELRDKNSPDWVPTTSVADSLG